MTDENIEWPHAPEAEAAILCCIIDNPKTFVGKAWDSQISAEYFHGKAKAQVWKLVTQRALAGKGIDPVSLREAINNDKPEGLAILDLHEILQAEYDPASWLGYVETIRDRYARRISIEAGKSIHDGNTDGATAISVLRKAAETAANALQGSSLVMDAETSVKSFVDSFKDRYQNGRIPGLSTGIDQIDAITGGLRKGELFVVGAKTSGGKSVLMLQIVDNAIRAGKRVAVFSLEMGVDEVIGRLLACGERIHIGHILNPRDLCRPDIQKIEAASEAMKKTGLMVCDAGDMTIEAISGHCQRLADTGGLDLIVIDYLQMVTSPRVKGQNREQEVAAISKACKQLAKRIKCPVITATQLNEQGQARESRAIENDADTVLLIQSKQDGDKVQSVIQVWKCRNGKRGDEIRVSLHGEHQRFIFL